MTLQKQLQNYAIWLEQRGLSAVSRVYELAKEETPKSETKAAPIQKTSNIFVISPTATKEEQDLILKIVAAMKLGDDFYLYRASKDEVLSLPATIAEWQQNTNILVFDKDLSEASTGKAFSEVVNKISPLDAIGVKLFTTHSPIELIKDPSKKAPLWAAIQQI